MSTGRWKSLGPDPEGYSTRWYVLSRDVLPLGPPPDDIIIRSHQVLAWMLRSNSTLDELVRLLDDPPTPPAQLAALQSTRMKFGAYTIAWDQVVV